MAIQADQPQMYSQSSYIQ